MGEWDPTRFERITDDRRIVERPYPYGRPSWDWYYTRFKRIDQRMFAADKEAKRKPHSRPIERCAVAFGVKGRSCVLAFVGPTFEFEEENGEFYEDLTDLLGPKEDEGAEGLYIWEGWPKGDYSHGEWGSEFDGYSFGDGAWRDPTDEEVEHLRIGCNPWVEKCPDCGPCPHCNGTGSDCSKYPIEGCKLCDGYGRKRAAHLPPLPPPEPKPETPILTFRAMEEGGRCPRCKGRGSVRSDAVS